MFSHGTLMFDTEIEEVVNALRVKKDKIESKGIKSIRSRVTNISEYMDKPMTIEEFRMEILKSVFGGEENIQYKELTDEDWKNIHALSNERYGNWDWNYGRSPKCNVQHSHRFPVGSIDVRLQVDKGTIHEVHIFGDFFGIGSVTEIEERLVNCKYDRESIAAAVSTLDIPKLLGGITQEEFVNLIY